ncbi:MAG TPA: DUF2062 domain-containing protein [Phycisphaerae bacterium]|nr:DUF2062 domain-containing protein [Phycisphaerae bacterium]HNU45166.1 DUF2062 domain-containing protein [Phycisphaerae bacterium]
MGTYWQRARRIVAHTVLHADDTPRRIALGAAIATFVAFLPLMGVQTVVSIALAALVRANKAICVPTVWITNPATAVPIYSACYALGRFVLRGHLAAGGIDVEKQVLGQLAQHHGWGRFVDPAFWKDAFNAAVQVGADLWVGCALAGVVFGTVAYFVVGWAVVKYRARHRRHLLRRGLLRRSSAPVGVSRSQDAPGPHA